MQLEATVSHFKPIQPLLRDEQTVQSARVALFETASAPNSYQGKASRVKLHCRLLNET